MRTSLIVTLALVLLMSVSISTLSSSDTITSPRVESVWIPSDYVAHDPVSISSDADFETQGWSGNGTESNPYLIDGFTINGSQTPSEICLMVENTRAHFSVTNCYLFDGLFGIHFDNVSNARIENNEIYEVEDGVSIAGSDFNTIQNNTIFGNLVHNSNQALVLYNCDNTTIANNTCIGYWNFGIKLSSDCYNDTISSNFCTNTGNYGIWLWDSSQNTIFNNTCTSSSFGIWIFSSQPDPLYHCYGNIILNNSCDDNGYGMWIERCSSFTIVNNTIRYSTYNGVVFNVGRNSNLTDNQMMYSVQRGIYLGADSEFNTLYRNLIGWNGLGGGQENAEDYGSNNSWDDGVSIGNMWSDYTGSTTNYTIHGSAGSVDHYPLKADTISPTIDTPNDREVQFGYSGYSIAWNPYDEHPDTYSVYREEALVESDIWYGTGINVDIDGLEMGVYNYTIIVYDTCWNTAIDTVIVTVHDTIDPVIDDENDFQIEIGTTGFGIQWSITEVNPDSFEVLRNGTTIDSGPWDGSDIGASIDGLDIGTHNFTLVVYDTSYNSASNTVIVTVILVDTTSPTLPTTTTPPSTTDTTSPTTTVNGTTQFPVVMVFSIIGGACGIIAIIVVIVVIRKQN